MKYFIHLSYKGTRYHGWQRQTNDISVQETLENAVQKMVGHKINCIGCGRTDAGVHASQFYCHIRVDEPFDYDPVFRLNKILPDDISIYEIFEVAPKAHAQRSATRRTYTYNIHTQKDALLSEYSSLYDWEKLDFGKMKKAVALLPNYQDYKTMCIKPDIYRNTLCYIYSAELVSFGNGKQIQFKISANRFLRGMVRILMAQIIEVGFGKTDLSRLEDSLKNGTPRPLRKKAFPQGLFLSEVHYPFMEEKPIE